MLTTPSSHAWLLFLAQNSSAGAAPASPAQPVNAVGVPGTSSQPAAGPATNGAPPAGPAGGSMIFWLLPAMLLVMILMSVMGGRKEKKKRAELMESLKKGERVQTIGGVLGTITEIGEQDLVLRVEEGRIRVLKTAVQTVLSKDKPASSLAEAKPEAKTAV